ncbi:beta-N-acetylhexosaminidase [Sphingomonas nostoxanthinifaciens]|uniref:beta-N-acetylhexosaminidase n=1 Tax=Sphingomonas nostoxanthinifaciens TaxID=2872652 RepID=UPI001CC1F975|nr:beta-N-acetylhexosaminidase [Sphingomonas nostoxanthinifaciens]UAK24822.1 beta-N-acetylhexosaminidase [Sphingomonas nostoxanthinifaciens]
MTPLILGLAGLALSADERAFFRAADPAGYILFRRNVVDRAQLRALTDDLRALAGRDDLPILIDQEGGRVARMQPPEWPAFPPGTVFDAAYERAPMTAIQAMRANAQALAVMLREVGITVDCLPLLDVRQPGAHDIIGDRALGAEPLRVAALGRATIEGLRAGGVVGVVKHVPGHGRAMADSHVELPLVDAPDDVLQTDLAPFRALAGAPMAMTAHVVYTAWDRDACASLSPTIIRDIVRGRIGFDGFLMSDDLGMHALQGDFGARAAGVIAAGCDVGLHCSGDIAEMEACVAAVEAIAPRAQERLEAAMATIAGATDDAPFEALVARRDALLDYKLEG